MRRILAANRWSIVSGSPYLYAALYYTGNWFPAVAASVLVQFARLSFSSRFLQTKPVNVDTAWERPYKIVTASIKLATGCYAVVTRVVSVCPSYIRVFCRNSKFCFIVVPDIVNLLYIWLSIEPQNKGKGPYIRSSWNSPQNYGRHLSMGSHSVICHLTEVTAPPSPQYTGWAKLNGASVHFASNKRMHL